MPDQKTLVVTDQRRQPYTRVIRTAPVTFECEECHQVVTIEQYPGGQPHYCFDCLGTVNRRRSAERVWRFRERQRGQR